MDYSRHKAFNIQCHHIPGLHFGINELHKFFDIGSLKTVRELTADQDTKIVVSAFRAPDNKSRSLV